MLKSLRNRTCHAQQWPTLTRFRWYVWMSSEVSHSLQCAENIQNCTFKSRKWLFLYLWIPELSQRIPEKSQEIQTLCWDVLWGFSWHVRQHNMRKIYKSATLNAANCCFCSSAAQNQPKEIPGKSNNMFGYTLYYPWGIFPCITCNKHIEMQIYLWFSHVPVQSIQMCTIQLLVVIVFHMYVHEVSNTKKCQVVWHEIALPATSDTSMFIVEHVHCTF